MTKEEFISELRKKLSGLPEKEIEEGLSFYCEIIDDKIEEGFSEEEAVSGVGSVDEIASQIGIHTDSDYRIRSGVLYTLLQAVAEGHCYLPRENLLSRTQVLLGVAQENIDPHIENLMMDKK